MWLLNVFIFALSIYLVSTGVRMVANKEYRNYVADLWFKSEDEHQKKGHSRSVRYVSCSLSDNLRLIRHFEKGGSGSSGLEFKRPAVGAASDGLRWWQV